jgi:hypothetical protein
MFAAVLAGIVVFQASVMAQSLLSGDISGTVTDASNAVIAGATVDLKNLETGAATSTKTESNGAYRFSLLKPGLYSVTAKHAGFKPAEKNDISVQVGKISTADIQLAVGDAASTVVDVTANQDVLSSAPNGSTSFTPLEVELLPSPGGDITNIAFTASGVVMNTVVGTTGYGNFSMNGLPATSNLYTVNGENNMDPYFNINNSGATNLTLGQNEVQEATVMASPYGGEYGQLSGAQVIAVTKSGSNAFHGNAQYWWNGRAMNSNDWFNNYYGEAKPFSNANQWATSVGGPIRKNKTFFFVDEEGLRFVLPSVVSATIPTPAFSAAVLANVTAKQPNEAAAYKTLLNLWDTAPGSSSAQPIANSTYCNALSLPGFNPATTPCAERFEATPSALASENFLAFRIDQKLSDKDNLYYRYRLDHGTQPTVIDPINANFDALSKQPQYDNQLSETHIFSPNATNQFMGSFSHYVAQFSQDASKVQSTFPYMIVASGAVPFTEFNLQGDFPQGRNITQYQIVDDYTLVKGKHTFKFGENYRRYDVSDHTFFFSKPAVYFGYVTAGLQNFVNGLAYQYRQSKNIANDVPIALWGMGSYAHDDWKIASNFTLTLGFRVEHNSNPVCQFNCFANFKGEFSTLASATSTTPGNVPFSADLNYGQHTAYPSTDGLNIAPSVGFSWSPAKNGKTVISGGFGVFYDNAPSGLVDDLTANPPASVALRVRPAAGILPFDSGPSGGAAVFAASANAFNITQTPNQINAALTALGANFTAPAVTSLVGTIHSPRVEEWNIQVQRQLGPTTSLIVNYAGNHGGNLLYTNAFYNAYDLYGLYPGVAGISAKVPDPNYGQVTEVHSGAVSNYDGLQITIRKQFSHNVSGHFNYTWSHSLDEVSNGGLYSYGDSLLGQLTPGSLSTNYGNADYDIRHTITADFIFTPKVKTGNKFVDAIGGHWQFGTKMIYHSGMPFSVTDSNTALGNYTGSLLAIPTGRTVMNGNCGLSAVNTPCLNTNAFVDGAAATFSAYSSFSPQTRNQFRGPGYFNLDLNVFRNFPIKEGVNFGIGMTAFNFLNHPNFANPDSGYGDSSYGMITGMVGSPTSAYGNFLGFDSSIRVIQLSGKITF